MLRIVAGTWGGRRIQAPRGRATRPTAERVREAIFNALGHQIAWEDHPVFDLYAGSGALGIEALSRGAPRATFVESDARAAKQIAANLRGLGAPEVQWSVSTVRVETWLERVPFPPLPVVVFADPPYAADALPGLLRKLAGPADVSTHPSMELTRRAPTDLAGGATGGLAEGSWIVAECGGGDVPWDGEVSAPLELYRVKRYGDTSIAFISKGLRNAD